MSGLGLVAFSALLLNLYALILVLLRAPLFRTRLYRPMVKNICLSVAPPLVLAVLMAASLAMLPVIERHGTGWPRLALLALLVVGGLAWLLVLPNSAYLVTELNFSHRKEEDRTPLWYDIVLTLTLALSGIVNALASVVIAQLIYLMVVRINDPHPWNSPDSWILVLVVLTIMSFGIYLGRYIRFNSWDVLHPWAFAAKLIRHFRSKGKVAEVAGFTVSHTALFAVLYLLLVAPAVALLSE